MSEVRSEEGEIEQNGWRDQKLPADCGRITLAGGSTGATMLGSRLRLRQQHRKNDQAENRRADIGAAPTKVTLHRQQRHRRDGRAKHAGESVEGENLAKALWRSVMRQQRVVRGVINGVAEPGDAVHGNEDPI